MNIYPIEESDGLSEIISAKASISYASIVKKSAKNNISYNIENKSIAGLDDSDLYYTQSILVTTSWNKNDDIFDKSEVWLAKATPTHKPTNLEHNENIIVGHITSNYPMTEDGILIDENTPVDNLPEKFHILTGSVIYKGYTEPDLRARSLKLIEEIENGTKYVSMECFFNGFDYGLINKTTNEYKVLNRNSETAFLTKHLRAYGGVGEHENYKIGRVLRNITFSGKGFVDKPANPESVIFTKDNLGFDRKIATIEIYKEKNSTFSEIGVFSNQANLKENIMSLDFEPVLKEIAAMNTKIEAMTDCSANLVEANARASALSQQTTELENSIKAQEVLIEDAKKTIETLSSEKEEAAKKMMEDIKKKDEEMMKMKAELDAANEVIAAYKDKEEEMMKKEKKMKRMATLVDNGLDQQLANATADKFESLSDEAFENMTSLLAAMNMKMKKMLKAEEVEQPTAEASETENKAEDISAALENVETASEIDLSVGSENETDVNSTRAALVDFVYTRLGKKLNKGE